MASPPSAARHDMKTSGSAGNCVDPICYFHTEHTGNTEEFSPCSRCAPCSLCENTSILSITEVTRLHQFIHRESVVGHQSSLPAVWGMASPPSAARHDMKTSGSAGNCVDPICYFHTEHTGNTEEFSPCSRCAPCSLCENTSILSITRVTRLHQFIHREAVVGHQSSLPAVWGGFAAFGGSP